MVRLIAKMLMLRTKGITLKMTNLEMLMTKVAKMAKLEILMLMLMNKVTGLSVEGGRKLVEELAAKTKQVEGESF